MRPCFHLLETTLYYTVRKPLLGNHSQLVNSVVIETKSLIDGGFSVPLGHAVDCEVALQFA